MITFHRLLEIYGIQPESVRLVRHGNKEIQIRETFQNNLKRFEAYQTFQKPNKFGNSSHIAVFAPYYKTTAIFLGLWKIKGNIHYSKYTKKNMEILERYELPEEWFTNSAMYILERDSIIDDLSERLVIEWGASTVSWVQSKDKEVIEIKAKKSIAEFQSFNQVDLSFHELVNLVDYPDTNQTWIRALSSVNGIYLIQDRSTGKLYVGSAYGEKGIFGRWSNYAKNGHGGNIDLKGLNPTNFKFTILEVVSATMTADGVIDCENRWKEKLGTRKFGLNNN